MFTKDGKEIQEELLLPMSEASKNMICLLETTNYLVPKNINYTRENGNKKT